MSSGSSSGGNKRTAPTDVIKIHVDVAVRCLDELLRKVRRTVVQADVCAQRLDPSTLVGCTSDTDNALAADDLLRNLDCGRASRSKDNRVSLQITRLSMRRLTLQLR
jgi:hypothetical protein